MSKKKKKERVIIIREMTLIESKKMKIIVLSYLRLRELDYGKMPIYFLSFSLMPIYTSSFQ